eukprot:15360924-Ditylum_brightwellii.AAC.1
MESLLAVGLARAKATLMKHIIAVADIKAEREREKKEGKPKKHSYMTCFFKSLGKKKKIKTTLYGSLGFLRE